MLAQKLNNDIKNILLYQLELSQIQKKYGVYQLSESNTRISDFYVIGDNSYTEAEIQNYEIQIKEMIKEWYNSKHHDESLHEYIGMNEKEYNVFAQGGLKGGFLK